MEATTYAVQPIQPKYISQFKLTVLLSWWIEWAYNFENDIFMINKN